MIPLKPLTRANAPINDLTPHQFNVCSNLPNFSQIGIFLAAIVIGGRPGIFAVEETVSQDLK